MHWKKLGHVYGPAGDLNWAVHSALTPTPFVLNDATLRVYAGFRDAKGVSRIGWVDLDRNDLTQVQRVGRLPALDVGKPGRFDDNGIILGDIVQVDGRVRMYYVGFQIVQNVKFLAFTGVAESTDGGDTFERIGEAPILDRSNEGLCIRAIHSVMRCSDHWRIWYSVGSDWQMIAGKPFPRYHICTMDSTDGLTFASAGTVCIRGALPEYRHGRPRVWRTTAGYHMLFTYGTITGDYLPGYAHSVDGVTWLRDDTQVGMELSSDGWDSRSLCYLAPILVRDRWYAVYNGNDMGKDGFGIAVLESE